MTRTHPLEDLRTLLENGPSDRVVFVRPGVAASKLAEILAALANASGGTVVIGVDERGAAVIGVPDLQEVFNTAIEAALDVEPPLVIPLPRVAEIDSAAVVVVSVPEGMPHVYSFRGRYPVRAGRANRILTTPELRRLMLERGEVVFESEAALSASRADLSEDKIRRYLAAIEEGIGGLSPEAVLRQRRCLTPEGRPTNAGILLFGRDPQEFVPGSEVIIVRYAGREQSDTYLREDIRDTLPEAIRRAEAFVVNNMRIGARLTGLAREERHEYPREAVREAIVNAIAHRDYSIRGQETRIFMFADRIEITSPGRLPGPVTLDNIHEERFSRNETIVQVLSDLGFIERLGYGIDRMRRLMAEANLPPPALRETANGFQVTLYGHGDHLVTIERAPFRASQWAHLGLNDRQEHAMLLVSQQGRVTNRDLQEFAPDVSAETIRRDLSDLVDKNLLLKIGEKRATYYILK
jgi:ATP-dependent DNA helicase RecG